MPHTKGTRNPMMKAAKVGSKNRGKHRCMGRRISLLFRLVLLSERRFFIGRLLLYGYGEE